MAAIGLSIEAEAWGSSGRRVAGFWKDFNEGFFSFAPKALQKWCPDRGRPDHNLGNIGPDFFKDGGINVLLQYV